jgi:dihydropyrimidine dehydrogenase (NAD+) subunit PreA
LVSPDGALVEPRSYDVRSNGRLEAVETRPQPVVREQDCVGCRLCYNICPVDNCITMVEVPSGRSEVTWSELSEQQAEVTEDWEEMKAYRDKVGIHIH